MRYAYILCNFLMLICSASAVAQKVYPTHWFTGMKEPVVQLMIHHQGIGSLRTARVQYPGVSVVRVSAAENPNYLFVDLRILPEAKAGTIQLKLTAPGKEAVVVAYQLKQKNPGDGKTRIQGVTQADFIYLLMPDRFANGDPSNDSFAEMRDTVANRASPFARHGGDLQGIADHLDYLKELGVTTIWPTPVVENDMGTTSEGGSRRSTYHGYAFTDQYQVDRRFGGNDGYRNLVDAAHAAGLKFIQDAVYNHVGSDHWFIRDLPMKDWVNQWPAYTNSSYKDQPVVDPYASRADYDRSVKGWFTPFMPDLNQRNPFVATFLIQYAVWATEEFGIDGWRVDTYFYSDGPFLNRINEVLLREFPRLTVFGEAWVQTVLNSAFFAQNNLSIPFKHNSQGVTDFPLFFAMIDGARQESGWSDGVNKIYSTLAQDIAYKDPSRNCIFLDNHDLDRVFSVIGEDMNKYRMVINWLLTLRGIPQLYYGTEILMKNFKNPSDAEVRRDFPGGWKGDATDKFTAAGRSPQEDSAFRYVSTLANFRKTSPAITTGRLMQFVPDNGMYVYFRYSGNQTVMVISNTGKQMARPDWSRYGERTTGFARARNVQSGEAFSLNSLELKPGESLVLELLK